MGSVEEVCSWSRVAPGPKIPAEDERGRLTAGAVGAEEVGGIRMHCRLRGRADIFLRAEWVEQQDARRISCAVRARASQCQKVATGRSVMLG